MAAGLLAAAPASRAQTVPLPVLTAAFLLNFVKFTDWPADVLSPEAPVLVCVADTEVAEAALDALAGQSGGARTMNVTRVTTRAVPAECGVFYVPDLGPRDTDALVASLRGRSVLSVSNTEAFTRHGGIIHLFIEDGGMKFGVNPAAADRARLRMSSRLLALARIVKE
jgi:hypothetical protein